MSKALSEFDEQKLHDYLFTLWKRILGIENLKETDDFLQLGGQSIEVFRMLSTIENDFDQEFDFDAFFDDASFSVLLELLINAR